MSARITYMWQRRKIRVVLMRWKFIPLALKILTGMAALDQRHWGPGSSLTALLCHIIQAPLCVHTSACGDREIDKGMARCTFKCITQKLYFQLTSHCLELKSYGPHFAMWQARKRSLYSGQPCAQLINWGFHEYDKEEKDHQAEATRLVVSTA